MNIKRLDDPTIPIASTLVGLIIYGMQGGQTVKVTPTLLGGSDGVDGVDGASAYEVAVDNGFVGTQADWLDSLIGNSAYEEWVANGGVGTFQDFLDEIVETVNLLIPQTLTEAQKEQVRENINVLSQSVITDELAKKAEHGYAAEETPKTLKQVDDEVSQLAGDVSVKMANLFTNGDFSNGLTGWDTSNSEHTYAVASGILTATRVADGDLVFAIRVTSGETPPNSVVYTRYRVRVLQAGTPSISINYGTKIKDIISSPNTNQWYDVSDIDTTGSSPYIRSGVRAIYPTGQALTGYAIEVDYGIHINLTQMFGSGNEPTKEEMDLLISTLGIDYFEGEITIPAQKVMQWQLKLIRKNKNAIIALGGTII